MKRFTHALLSLLCLTALWLPSRSMPEPAAAQSQVLTLTNEGDAGVWRHIGPYGGTVTDMVVTAEMVLYAGTDDSGVFRSDDLGDHWTPMNAGLGDLHITQLALSEDGAALMAIADGELYQWLEADAHWSLMPTEDGMVVDQVALSPGYAQDGTLFVRGHNANHLTDGEDEISGWQERLIKSVDEAHSWQVIKEIRNWTDPDTGCPGWGTILFVTVSPAYSHDRTVFVAIEEDVYGVREYSIDIDLYKSVDGGDSWATISHGSWSGIAGYSGSHASLTLSPDYGTDQTLYYQADARVAWAVSEELRAGLSTDGGKTWQEVDWPWEVAFSPNYAQDQTLFSPEQISTEGGETWTEWDGPWSLSFSPHYATDHTILAPGQRSHDGGQNWETMENVGLTNLTFSDIAVSPDWLQDGTLFAASQDGLYRSADRGASLHPIAQDQPLPRLLAISPNYAPDGTIYAASKNRVIQSTDQGTSWTDVTESLDYYGGYGTEHVSNKNEGIRGTNQDTSWMDVTESRDIQGWETEVHEEEKIFSLVISPDYANDGRVGIAKSYYYDDIWGSYRSYSYVSGIARGRTEHSLWSWKEPTSPQILDVSPDYGNDGLVLVWPGDGQLAYTSDRRGWTPRQLSGQAADFYPVSVEFLNQKEGWISGPYWDSYYSFNVSSDLYHSPYWILLHTEDGGKTWGLRYVSPFREFAMWPEFIDSAECVNDFETTQNGN